MRGWQREKGGSVRKDEFKLVQIYICHLNHHKNSSTFKLFRKCPIWKPKFWRTSYKWMCALSWLIGRSVGWLHGKNQKKSWILHGSSLGLSFVAAFEYVWCTRIKRWNDVISSSVRFLCIYTLFFCSQWFLFRWIYHKNTTMSNICAFIDDNLWFKRRQTEFA